MRRRLARAGHDAERIAAVLDRLRAAGYIDDDAFASYWVEQRQTFRPRGARLLRAELRQRGITSELPELDAHADAVRAAAKPARQLAHLEESQFRARLAQRLARRGFDWDVIEPTVSQLWAEVSTSSGSARAPTA